MAKAFIIVNAHVRESGEIISTSPATRRMVTALKQAIAFHSSYPVAVDVVAASALLDSTHLCSTNDPSCIYCPLTIELPASFQFREREIFKACKDIKPRRRWVEQELNYLTGNTQNSNWFGHYWLPIVLTDKGPLYAEVIGEGELPYSYHQPVEVCDHQRQSLYYLAYKLLNSLSAPPSVYLLQFGLGPEKQIIFDRLWPFPAAPAIASIGIQDPDLFACHWYCLNRQPIYDLTIAGMASWKG